MSRIRGSKVDVSVSGFRPGIKWNRSEKIFVVLVPDMYELMMNQVFVAQEVRIKEEDLYRMINADKGVQFGFWFDFDEEQGDLDDDTYLGISFVQARYYLSVSVLAEAKRVSKRCKYPQWVFLKKRVKRGGRPLGSGGRPKSFCDLSEEEKERILYLVDNYEVIVDNMCKNDRVFEYVELEKDICLYEGKKFLGKKKTIAHFAEIRQNWLEKNG